MGQPCDGVGLAASHTVLDEVVLSDSAHFSIGNQLGDDIELMIAREDHRLTFVSPAPVVLFIFDLKVDVTPYDLKPGLFVQDFFPELISGATLEVWRITGCTVVAF